MTESQLPPHAAGGTLRSVGALDFDEQAFVEVMREALDALERRGIPHLLMGGLAVSALGRPRWTHDVDVFLRPDDARRALDVLNEAGFDPEEHDPLWLFKAVKRGVLVDLIFCSVGGIYLDDAMLARAVETSFKGTRVRVLPPEDLIVIKAAALTEDAAYHWFDALSLLTADEVDWAYLLERARRAVRRVLAFLVFAESCDAAVPRWVVADLCRRAYGDGVAQPGGTDRGGVGEPGPAQAQEVRDLLLGDARVRDLDIGVELYGDTVLLTGEVATEERRALLTEVATELLPARRVDNRTTVRRLTGSVAVEDVS